MQQWNGTVVSKMMRDKLADIQGLILDRRYTDSQIALIAEVTLECVQDVRQYMYEDFRTQDFIILNRDEIDYE